MNRWQDMAEDYARLSPEELVVKLGELLSELSALQASRTEADENRRLMQELRIHQVELEMQNQELRRAQIDLATSRDRCAELYDSTPVASFTLDPSGTIEEVNRAGVELLRMGKRQLVGVPFVSVAHLERARPFFALLHACSERRRPAEGELRRVGGDGVVQCLHATAAPVLHASGRVIACRMALTDVTRLRSAEEELKRALDAERRLKDRLASITRAHVDVSAVIADQPTGVEPVLQVVVDRARTLVGAEYTAIGVGGNADRRFDPWVFSGMTGAQASAIGHGPRRVGVLAAAADAPSSTRKRDLREDPAHRGFPPGHPPMTSFLAVPIRRASHSLGTLYAANKIGADAFTGEDALALEMLAGRVAAALEIARLRDAETRGLVWLREVVSQMPQAVVLVGEVEGGAITLNHAARALFGETVTLVEPGGATTAEEALPHRRASRGEVLAGLELRARRPDGTLVPVLVNAAPVEDGRPGSAVAVFQDLTAQKQLEQEREAWTSVVAHDLRQPLAVIDFAARVLERSGAQLGAPEIKAMGRIREGVGTLVRMIDDLLDVALIDLHRLTIKPRSVDLTELVEEIVDRCRPSLGDHRVQVVKPPGASILRADPDRLGQLLGNLLSNAAKYAAPGSDVEVHVTRSDVEVEVAVTNRGEGLRPDEVDRLFQRFHRTERAALGEQRGLGLGLYIAKGIVEGHGGRIAVESAPGESTTFRFWLPAFGAQEG